MGRIVKAVDVGGSPDILRLAREVRRTGQSRVLRDGADELAILAPVDTSATPRSLGSERRARGRPSDAVVARSRAGIRAAAGAWKDVDAEALKAYVRERRDASTRPSMEL